MATKPSLALIPSGYKASKVYSVLPSNGDGDFTFTRSGTATRVNAQGLIETVDANTPRLNYPLIDGEVSGCPSLLLEPSRQNKLLYSEDFNNSYWLHSTDITVTDSTELAPNGQLDANLIEFDGSNYSYIRRNITVPSNGTTLSVFAKKGNWRYLGFRQFQSTGVHTVFDFDTETFPNVASGQSASFEAYPNGWYRIEVKHPSPESNVFIGFALTNSSGSELNPTGGQVANVHLFGAQVEEGSYPTSYIPTSGTTITRTKPVTSSPDLSANGVINSTEGTYFIDVKFPLSTSRDASTGGFILGSDNSFPSPQALEMAMNTNGSFRIGKRDAGFTQIFNTTSGVFHKIAFKWSSLNVKLFVDGTLEYTGTYTSTPFKYIYSDTGDGSKFIKDIRLYSTALTDTELEELTTI